MTTRKNDKTSKSKKPTTNGSRANGSRRNAGYGALNPKSEDLAKNMEESAGEFLTSDQGIRINDNQNSLKAGNRGPSLLEDFLLREKITHFDHERIPRSEEHTSELQ